MYVLGNIMSRCTWHPDGCAPRRRVQMPARVSQHSPAVQARADSITSVLPPTGASAVIIWFASFASRGDWLD